MAFPFRFEWKGRWNLGQGRSTEEGLATGTAAEGRRDTRGRERHVLPAGIEEERAAQPEVLRTQDGVYHTRQTHRRGAKTTPTARCEVETTKQNQVEVR